MTFGERLRQVRERRGMSQQELADRAQVSRQLVYFLESGRRESTSVEVAKRIALALGTSVDYLVGTWEETRAAVA